MPSDAPAVAMVPAVPTEAMKVAGGVAFENAAFGDEEDVFEAAGLAYQAMLKAAGVEIPADPLDTPLPCAVELPGMRIGKGVALRVLVDAARRWKQQLHERHAARVTPEQRAAMADLQRTIAGEGA